MAEHWKGYVIPGPRAPGRDDPAANGVPDDQTLDAWSGFFCIFKYHKGHRFSTDDLLVAWYGTSHGPSASRVLDLGSGIGTVAMIAAWRLPGAHFVTVEAQAISIALARKSLRYNGLEERFDARQGDFRDPGVLGADERFDLVLGSPPYFPLEDGIHGDHEQKIACRFEVRGSIADYCAVAARHLAPGGMFACVFPIQPAHQAARVRDAADAAGLTVLRRRDVVLKEGEPPLLGLFLMSRATDLPEAMRGRTFEEPPLVIRRRDGSVHPEYAVVKMAIGFPP
ncbi:MAG: tRNA1(Val) (adenine(37)-N6)-methyltransferase [Myxococcales bacterium]